MLNQASLFLIHFYRLFLSRFFGGHCRFYPSCSEYGLEAYRTHCFSKATSLIVRRLLKCHPLGSHGFDPIPGKEKS